MAKKHELRRIRTGTIINVTSKKQETEVIKALVRVVQHLVTKFGKKVALVHEKQWYLKDIVRELQHTYPDTDFHYHFDTSSIRPDEGILYMQGPPEDQVTYPILIAEVKNQGTNGCDLGKWGSRQRMWDRRLACHLAPRARRPHSRGRLCHVEGHIPHPHQERSHPHQPASPQRGSSQTG